MLDLKFGFKTNGVAFWADNSEIYDPYSILQHGRVPKVGRLIHGGDQVIIGRFMLRSL